MSGCDFTDKTLTGSELKAAGKAFCCRYLPYPGGEWKAFSNAEAADKTAHGIRIVSNWETDGKPVNTVAKGEDHARRALAAHKACGGPDWAPIYFSIDSDVPVDSKDLYREGLHNVLGDRVGVYGSSGLVRHWLSKGTKYGWRAMATGWRGGAVTTGCSLVQTSGGHIAGTSVDFDTALVSNYGGWFIGEPNPNTPKEDDVELTDKITLVNQPDVKYSSPSTTVAGVLASTNYYVLQTRNQLNAKLAQVIDLLGDSAKVEAAVASAVAKLPSGSAVVTADALQAALVAALKELASEDDAVAPASV